LCQPSHAEGFGYPPLEAMARGVPVIAPRVGALPEVLGNAAQWMDDPTPHALVAAFHALLNDPQRHAQLVNQAQARAALFTRTRMINAHLTAYDEAKLCALP
jgi:glycosyltransferase involved in cell wall biosynthesis